jgi:serine/threonine-protein kinase
VNAERWEEIQAGFNAMLELDATERARRLSSLRRTDLELHQALQSLLQADEDASAELAPLVAALGPMAKDLPDPLGIAGRSLAHFELGEALGAGGMGVVYRAHDTRLGRVVALKFLLPDYHLDTSAKARFLREARSAAALDHPNLCAVHEAGTSENGWLYIAMALYEGETLRAHLDRDGPVPVRDAVAITRQIAEGLRAAHTAEIVHRDLKPRNVMVLPDGTIRILDFGLAKALDETLSETGARLGTVSYMSPEQLRGESVDQRADLWALGVVLYEMLTGRKPFAGSDEVAIAHAILHSHLELPSQYRPDLSGELERVVLRLLEKDSAKRYKYAAAVLRDLSGAEISAGGPIDAMIRRWRRSARVVADMLLR